MRVLSVASEVFPLVKTGGLADVVGALPGALAGLGVEVRTLVPGYPEVLAKVPGARTVHAMELMGGPARVRAARFAGLSVLVLDAPHLFDRPGGPYTAPGGEDWPDNPQRFAALGQAAAAVARGGLEDWRPDLVHAHDWQAGWTAAFLHYGPQPAPPVLFTVHNLAFQGWCSAGMLDTLGLPPESFDVEGVEFYGGISPLKAGLRLSGRVTTVSPGYAAEVLRPENGQGLDGLLRSLGGRLRGIVNGIDTGVWNPATDPLLPARYAGAHSRRRGRNRAALLEAFGVAPGEGPVFGVVSRLTRQKGIDLVLAALPAMLEAGGALVVLGTGEAALEAAAQEAAARHAGRVGVRIGYDEALAHLVQAGCDALLVPSRFEPCGLTQLCALRYGAIPVVSRVGGLADTVIDANPAALAAGVANGVQFLPVDGEGMATAVRRTAALYADEAAWAKLQRNAMRAPVGWELPAVGYAGFYHELVNEKGGTNPSQSAYGVVLPG